VNRRRFLLNVAAVPILLRDDPAALAARLGGVPFALVTADEEAHVVVVHLMDAGASVDRVIPTLPGPRSIQMVGTTAVVAHTQHGSVTLLDGTTLRIRRVLRGFGEPRYTAGSRDGRYAYISDSLRHEVTVVDIPMTRIVARTAVGGPARHITVVAPRHEIWVSLGSRAERVAILDVRDPARPRFATTIAPPFLAHDVGFQPGSTRVWVTSGSEGSLAVYDASTRHILRRLRADAPPQHVTFARGMAHVTSGDEGTLAVHSLSSGRVVRTARIPVGSYNVQEGAGGLVLTPSLERGTLCVFDAWGRLVSQLRVARSSHDACYAYAA
jgi:DNA-binding beta-propeller fold protein YncE